MSRVRSLTPIDSRRIKRRSQLSGAIILQTILGIDNTLLIDFIQLVSTLGVLAGAIFVALQLKQNNKQANMDMIMRLYEFANSAEVQAAWLTVLNTNIPSFEDFEKLSSKDKVSFYQIAALFESLGVLMERGVVTTDVIDDMFLTELAWRAMKPFVIGMRAKFGAEDNYFYFEKLYQRLEGLHVSATTA